MYDGWYNGRGAGDKELRLSTSLTKHLVCDAYSSDVNIFRLALPVLILQVEKSKNKRKQEHIDKKVDNTNVKWKIAEEWTVLM